MPPVLTMEPEELVEGRMRKTFAYSDPASVNEKDHTIDVTMTTTVKDREGDIIESSGGDLDNYEKNPVVQWAHNLSEPTIGRVVSFRKLKTKITGKVQFAVEENPFAQTLWNLYSKGYMRGWSIGFLVKKNGYERRTEKNDDGEEEFVGYRIHSWELLELSAVPVGCNQEALSKAVSTDKTFGARLAKAEIIEGDLDLVIKPYPNEHAARLHDPDLYKRFRRQNNKFGDGIHAIWGVRKDDDKVELQAIRFDKDKFTVAQAKKWLKDHDYKPILFEPASERSATEMWAAACVDRILDKAGAAEFCVASTAKGREDGAVQVLQGKRPDGGLVEYKVLDDHVLHDDPFGKSINERVAEGKVPIYANTLHNPTEFRIIFEPVRIQTAESGEKRIVEAKVLGIIVLGQAPEAPPDDESERREGDGTEDGAVGKITPERALHLMDAEIALAEAAYGLQEEVVKQIVLK